MSQQHKFIMAILVTALGGIGTGYSLNSKDSRTQDNANQISTSSVIATDHQIEITQLQQKIQQLQSDNRQLLQQLQNLSDKQSVSSVASQKLQNNEVNQELEHKLQALELEKQQRKANDFGAWALNSQKMDSRFDVNNELAQRFGQENRDSEWAEQQEQHYQQLFSSQEELRDFALRNAECRSTQCEVTVSVANSEQSRQLLQTMSRALEGSVILVATDEKGGVSKLYIGRDEKSFEFN